MSDHTTRETDRRTLLDEGIGNVPEARSSDAVEQPEAIGRYRVLEVLGEGGMGTVFGAYDPELDRKVALKLLHTRDDTTGSQTRARARLQREARAIAQVKHPNVIDVYDAGVVDFDGKERVFVAMEMVEGRSLRTWLEALQTTERWRSGGALPEILDVMAQAARGLAAAHDADLVHRDFKPDNALLGDDGVVRVVDFGLARRTDQSDTSESEPDPQSAPNLLDLDSGSLDRRLTQTGAMLGTPAYMAPEQFFGRAVDGRTDQFAFCLTLHEIMFAVRAFPGANYARAAAVVSGERCEFPLQPQYPTHMLRLLERGLQPDPDLRYPSMEALLEAMLDDPAQRRAQRLRRGVGGAAAAAAVAGTAFALYSSPAPPIDPCGYGTDRLATVWTPERYAAVESALLVDALPYAAHVATSASTTLDDFARAWADAHRDACEATHVRNEQTGALLDRRMACLDRRLAALDASVELLASTTPDQVEHAVAVASGLPAVDDCTARSVLALESNALPSDEAARQTVTTLEGELERVAALVRAHRDDEALATLTRLMPRVEATEYGPLIAEHLYELGSAMARAGKHEQSLEVLQRSIMKAQELGLDPLVRDGTSALSLVLGHDLARPAQGVPWADLAHATDTRIGPTEASRAKLLSNRAWLLAAWDMKPEAIEVAAEAMEAAEVAYDPESFAMIKIYANLASVFGRLRAVDRALPLFERAVALAVHHLGPDHPSLIGHNLNLSNAHLALGHPDEAGVCLQEASRLVELLPAVSVRQRSRIAAALGNHAMGSGDFEQAYTQHKKAAALRTEVYGPEHPLVARSLNSIAGAARRQGRVDEAVQLYARSLAIREAALGVEHPDLLLVLDNLSVLLVEEGRSAEAVPYFERADAILLAHGDIPARAAEHSYWFGRALIESNVDPTRGTKLVDNAMARYRELELDRKLKDAEEWLASR